MDNFENSPITPTNPQPENSPVSRADLQAVRQLVVSVLMLVLVVSGTFNIYLWRQYRTLQADFAPYKQQASKIMAEATRVNNIVEEVARKFLDFGKAHPDFMPILNKYGIRPIAPTNAPATSLSAPPAPAPAPKK